MNKTLLLCLNTIILSGCNTSSSEVTSTYKNVSTYKNQTCLELKNEQVYVEGEIQKMASIVDKTKRHQDTKLSFGWVFFPSYFIIDDNSKEAEKLSILKGEYEAILRSIKSKQCTF
jgi:uncharacterized protein YcfL